MATPGIDTKVVKNIENPNFVEKHEVWRMNPNDPAANVVCCYTPDGHYIGDLETAKYLRDKRGIKPELRKPGMNVCSVGFCEKDNKWYGWSHRAMVGFKVGDKLFEEKFGNDKTPYVEHGDKNITNLDEAREAASRFAESVAGSIPVKQVLSGMMSAALLLNYNNLLDRYRANNYQVEIIGTII